MYLLNYILFYFSNIWTHLLFGLQISSIHQIYDIVPLEDMHICRLCTIVLEVVHEMDRLDAPYGIGVVT